MKVDVFRRLQEADWSTIIRKLVLFAEYRARIYHWRTGGSWDLAKGWTPEDVVQQVIVKTINGDRRWDPAKGPLEPWLRDQVKSVVDHLYHSGAGLHEIVSLEQEGDEDAIERMALPQRKAGEFPSGQMPDPEQVVMARESKVASERPGRLFEAINGKKELEEVLDAILDGVEPRPRFLAAELGVSRRDINNRLKRLRRLALKLS